MQKMEPASENSDIIPEWFLWEVLIRLPSKFVIRCKLVSKQCASLISNPLFVRSYLSHHASSSSSWTVFIRPMINHSGNSLRFIELDLPEVICSTRYSFGSLCLPNIRRGQSYRVFGVSNGLVLFGLIKFLNEYFEDERYMVYNVYYLCNPVTGESIPLPPLMTRKFTTRDLGSCGPALVTRVKNAVLESFRVVLMRPFKQNECLRVSVCASETLQWEEFLVPCEVGSQLIYNAPTTLNQILHWDSAYGSIVAYDPYANPDRVRVIGPPPCRYIRSVTCAFCRLCNASRGKLRYFEKFAFTYYNSDRLNSVQFKLWVLEDSSGMWCLSHASEDTDMQADGDMAAVDVLKDLRPMFFNPVDEDILYLGDSTRLVAYDFRTRKVEIVKEPITHQGLVPWYVKCFVVEPSPWPISLSSFPCSLSAPSTNLLLRGVGWLCELLLDYFF